MKNNDYLNPDSKPFLERRLRLIELNMDLPKDDPKIFDRLREFKDETLNRMKELGYM